MSFHGFTPGILEALTENRVRNSREWYEAHKAQFKRDIYEPFYALMEDFYDQMRALDDKMYLVPRFNVARIVRDTRRTKDKSTLYRANLWCFFRRYPKTYPNAPFFYFEFYPDSYRYGFFFGPWETSALEAYRETVAAEPDALRKALRSVRFAEPELECFKKKYHGVVDDDLDRWYAAKNIHIGKTFYNMEALYDGSFVPGMREAFAQCEDLYRFLVTLREPVQAEMVEAIPQKGNTDEW